MIPFFREDRKYRVQKMVLSIKDISSKRSLEAKKSSYEFAYETWKEFTIYSPWKHFHNMELAKYIWTNNNTLYIFFESLTDHTDKKHFKIQVVEEDETSVREWLKERISPLWLI